MSLQSLTVLTAAGGMALVALSQNAYPVFFMFSALVAVIVVSYAAARLSPRGLRWRRSVSDRVFEGDAFAVRIELENKSRLPRFLLDIRDPLPEFLESSDGAEFMVPALWPNETVTVAYEARARKRGVYDLGNLEVSVSDPFGMYPRFVPVQLPGEAVIYPRPVPLGGEVGQVGVESRGLSTGERARASESGLDFYGVRDYRPGDELRRIHWPATAHHGKLTVIEFDRGTSEDVAVVLDTKSGSHWGAGADTTLEVGVRAAASLVHWALSSEGASFLAYGAHTGPRSVAVERLDGEHEVLEALARVKAESELPASHLLDWAGRLLPGRPSVFLITAAPDMELPRAIENLQRQHIRAHVILLDAHSFDPAGPYLPQEPELLEAAGARVLVLHREDDLAESLGSALRARDL